MIHKSKYIIENIKSIKDKVYELAIITPLLCDKDLLIVRPYTQYPIETIDNKKNYIDLYYEDIKLGVEIYEPFHKYQEAFDKLRKNEIEEKLECEIIEVFINEEFIITDEICKLKQSILKKVEEKRCSDNYQDWKFSFHTLTQVQEDYPNAILVNANNFHDGVHGPIRLNPEIIKNADLFIVYSGSTVYKAFEINPDSWIRSDDPISGFLQFGKELPNHPLISSGATDWNITTNRAYGRNIQKYISSRKSLSKQLSIKKINGISPKGKFRRIIRNINSKK